MNYHVEHHMFPMVPYHRLPELHEEIKNDLAPPYPSMWAAYQEIVPAVLRQLKDQTLLRAPRTAAGRRRRSTPASDGRALPSEESARMTTVDRRVRRPTTSTRKT